MTDRPKGWHAGAWNSELPVAVGYAHEALNDAHVHARITEIYLIGRGTSEIRVEGETVRLEAGDMIVVEPGEDHTFLFGTDDYLHFVIHTPSLSEDDVREETSPVPPSRFGL